VCSISCPHSDSGLTDIDGYSHLIVLWAFDRSEGFDLMVTPPPTIAPRPVYNSISAPPHPIGLTIVELLGRQGGELRVVA